METTMMITMMSLVMSYMANKSHMITSLMVIECMSLTCMFMMFYINLSSMDEMGIIIFMLVLSISESILGITLIISLIRTHSNDFVKTSVIKKL